MKTSIVLLAVFLAGCGGMVEPKHVAHAEKRCFSNGGVKLFEVHWLYSNYIEIRCNNGAIFKETMKDSS